MIGIVRVPSLPLVLPLRIIISERMTSAGVKTSMTFKLHASAMRQAVYRQTPKRARSRSLCKPSLNKSSISSCVNIFAARVPLFSSWCILDPTLQSLAYLLHCCIRLGYFLTRRVRIRQVWGRRAQSGLLKGCPAASIIKMFGQLTRKRFVSFSAVRRI